MRLMEGFFFNGIEIVSGCMCKINNDGKGKDPFIQTFPEGRRRDKTIIDRILAA